MDCLHSRAWAALIENRQIRYYSFRVTTTDNELLDRIRTMVKEEHELRQTPASAPGANAERLQALEVQLDQCWDLLRQRRAAREFGENPDEVAPRPAREVEGYQQ
ncbi:MAG: DUF2630 family protein [Corynebacteriales bacterium]|nr:DUF2630 family protein [Mycobacteriales bacterium]